MNHPINTTPKIAVSVGELSGDQHLSHVVREIKSSLPQAQIRGMGGRFLRAQGVETIVDSEKAAGVMGFFEVLAKLPSVLHARKEMIRLLREWKPDLLLVADYPDFNLRLAKIAKGLGIKVLYFIPPKVWVWRQSRTALLKEYTDAVACIFPHEASFLRSHGVAQACFVGHPFSGNEHFRTQPSVNRKNLFTELGLAPENPTVLFLPGSRTFEVERHAPTVMQGLERLRKDISSLQCIISQAPTIPDDLMQRMVSARSWIRVTKTPAVDLMKLCNAGIIKSGTSTLEATFIGLPFVCVYKAPTIAAFIVRCFADIKTISLPNLVVPDTVLELIQERFSPEAISAEIPVLLSPQGAQKAKIRMQKVVESLAGCDTVEGFDAASSAYARTAILCKQMLV